MLLLADPSVFSSLKNTCRLAAICMVSCAVVGSSRQQSSLAQCFPEQQHQACHLWQLTEEVEFYGSLNADRRSVICFSGARHS